jgi:hypothetical protein
MVRRGRPGVGFPAYGQVSVAIFGNDVNTPQTKRCIANSVQAGIDVRQGTPVIISLDGRAVGGGDLSTGELKQEQHNADIPNHGGSLANTSFRRR